MKIEVHCRSDMVEKAGRIGRMWRKGESYQSGTDLFVI